MQFFAKPSSLSNSLSRSSLRPAFCPLHLETINAKRNASESFLTSQ